jgi:hypothetical protein
MGGIVLVIEGLVVSVCYLIWSPAHVPTPDYFLTMVMLGGPPMVAGVLFLIRK